MTNLRSRAPYVLLLLSLGAAAAIGIGLPVIGVLTGGTLRANFAIALMIIAILVDLAVLFSYGTSLQLRRVALVAWLSVALTCLVFTQYILSLNYTDATKAADTVLIIVMLILSFPAGILVVGLTALYSFVLLSHRGVNSLDLTLIWSFFFVAGYLQWFKLISFLLANRRA